MADDRIPLAGRRKPPYKGPPLGWQKSWASSTEQRIERMRDGRYRMTNWSTDRLGQPMQVGATMICVVGDYGFLVVVEAY